MKKLKATVKYEWKYDADPKFYGTEDVEKMIEIDKKGISDDPFLVLQDLDFTIEIKEVKD
jgi:hypothetical protein